MDERNSQEKKPTGSRRRQILWGSVLLLLLGLGSHWLNMNRCFSRAREDCARNPDATALWVRTTGFSIFMKCEYGCNPEPEQEQAELTRQ